MPPRRIRRDSHPRRPYSYEQTGRRETALVEGHTHDIYGELAAQESVTQPWSFTQGLLVGSTTNNPVINYGIANNFLFDRKMGPVLRWSDNTNLWYQAVGGATPGQHDATAAKNFVFLTLDTAVEEWVYEVGNADQVVNFRNTPTVAGVPLSTGTGPYSLIRVNSAGADMTARGRINFIEGTGGIDIVPGDSAPNDETTITINWVDPGDVDADTVDTLHAASFLRSDAADAVGGLLTFVVLPQLRQTSNINTIKIQPGSILADRDSGFQWESDTTGSAFLFKHQIQVTTGDLAFLRYNGSWIDALTLDRSTGDLWIEEAIRLGGSLASPECSIVPNAAYLQLDANGYLWAVDGDIRIGASATADLKIHEPSADEWTIEALSTNKLILKAGSGSQMELDDGSTLNALIAGFHASTSAPIAQDYPDGTIWCVYTA